MRRLCTLFFGLLFAAVLPSFVLAQTNLYRLPDSYVTRSPGAVQLHAGDRTYDYVIGLGWLSAELNGSPIVQDDGVYVTAELLGQLGLELPRLAEIRSSNSDRVRIVFELEGTPVTSYLASQERAGQVGAGHTLELSLPQVLLPRQLPDNLYGIELELVTDPFRTRVYLEGPPMRYNVFTLQNPTRLVVDAVLLGPAPQRPAPALAGDSGPEESLLDGDSAVAAGVGAEAERDRQDSATLERWNAASDNVVRTLRPGVIYRRIIVPTMDGKSLVDILEIQPGYGEFRVVGESHVPRTLSELVNGGFAGINASYFNTSNLRTIGFLKVDNTLLSLPSRNRASIGFGLGRPVVARIQADLNVRVNGRLYYSGDLSDNRIQVYTSAGQMVGGPSQGAIVVQSGRVIANKVAPRQVPQNGFVIVYEPDIRQLALVDQGDLAAIEADLEPSSFDRVAYAVEAGPLLVENGRPAYAPKLEHFDTDHSWSAVNRRTARAAVGIRPDGTVLFVTTTNMTTSDLVPLFMSLGVSEALQMDSGGSSTLFAGGRVLNRPASSQREIATAIVFIPHGDTANKPY